MAAKRVFVDIGMKLKLIGPELNNNDSKVYTSLKQIQVVGIHHGDCAFPVAAARVWNSLPATVTSSPSLLTFRRRLKTKLFARTVIQTVSCGYI